MGDSNILTTWFFCLEIVHKTVLTKFSKLKDRNVKTGLDMKIFSSHLVFSRKNVR